MTPEERDEFAKLAESWRERALDARTRSGNTESAVLWAGKSLAYTDCAEHLEWFLSTRAKP